MEPERTPESSPPKNIVSPFSGVEGQVPQPKRDRTRLVLIGGAVLLLLAAGAVGGVVLNSYLNDPYRTMEAFPVEKFLDSPRSLTGTKFKAELRVEADLDYKEGVGRLMLFSSRQDSRPIAIMVPEAVGQDIYFTKGQSYIAELEVNEGGLIYENSCKNN
jgi:hypothetical protein